MAGGLSDWGYPLCRMASEIILLCYLVYGFPQKRLLRAGRSTQKNRTQKSQRLHFPALLLLYAAGAAVRNAEFSGMRSGGSDSLLIFLAMLFVFYLLLVLCLKINRRLAFYYAVVFVIPADLGDLLVFMVLVRGMGVAVRYPPLVWETTLAYVGASFLLRLLMLSVIRRFLEDDYRRTPNNLQLFMIALSVLPFVYIRNLGFWLPLASEEIGNVTILFLVVTGIIVLIVVIGNERLVYYHIQQGELMKTQHMIRRQHEQYEMRREAVDLVNQKYHDMRHQLLALLGMDDVTQIHAYVNALRREITPFETFFRTGNPMFDIILSEKAKECEKKGIRLLPMADGAALLRLEAVDLCTIFGNALDNAIESCEKIADTKLREITLRVCRIQGFLAVCIENPYVQTPRIEGGRLLSTKRDQENHGYGLQGIREAVRRYGGEMDTEMEGGFFTLTLLLPLEDEE